MEQTKTTTAPTTQVLEEILSSDGANVWQIRRGKNGHVYCTCPSWKYQRVTPIDRVCKHTRAWIATVAQQA